MYCQISDRKTLLIISEINKSSFYFWFFRVGGIGFMILFLNSIYNFPTSSIELFSTFAIGFLGIIMLLYFPTSNIIEIYKNKVVIFSCLGKVKKVITRNEIKTINEIIKPTRFGSFKLIEIKTIKTKYFISEARYKNYVQMKKVLISFI